MESENDIMREIHKLAETKTVVLISHRLLQNKGLYAKLWAAQQSLENYGKEAV